MVDNTRVFNCDCLPEMRQAIELTAKLYRCHNTAIRFFKDEWPEKFSEWRGVVENVMKRDSCKEIEAAITLGKDLETHGFSIIVMLATVAEMIEPKLHDEVVKKGNRYENEKS